MSKSSFPDDPSDSVEVPPSLTPGQPVLPAVGPGIETKPTRHVPMITAAMSQMLRALHDGSVWDLGQHLIEEAGRRLSRSRERQTELIETSSMELVVGDGDFGHFMQLLHSLSKETITACILGTLGYQSIRDVRRRAVNAGKIERPIKSFSGDGPGSYMAMIQVEGRNGWLNRSELGELIKALQMYLRVSLDEHLWKKSKRTTKERADVRFVYSVDSCYASKAVRGERLYVDSTRRGKKLDEFINSLKRLHSKIPHDVEYIMQSPPYVGCASNHMDARSASHDPDGREYSGCNFLLWLTASCLKVCCGVDSVVVCHPVIRTWEQGQVRLSEVLLTMLASSMCYQNGFNGHPPGTNAEPPRPARDWSVHKMAIMIDHPWYEENIAATSRVIAERSRLVDWYDSVSMTELKTRSVELKRLVADGEPDVLQKSKEAEEMLSAAETVLGAVNDEASEVHNRIEQHAAIRAFLVRLEGWLEATRVEINQTPRGTGRITQR